GLEKGLEELIATHRLLEPAVEIKNGKAYIRSDHIPSHEELAKLEQRLGNAIASFDDMFDAASRGLPEWRAIETEWKETIASAVRLHLPDFLTVQNAVDHARNTVLNATFNKVETEFAAILVDARSDAGEPPSHTGSGRILDVGAHAARIRKAMAEFDSAANLYGDHSRRIDDSLAHTDALLGKPGVEEPVLIERHAALLDARTMADVDAIQVFSTALLFSTAYDPDNPRFDPDAQHDFAVTRSRMRDRLLTLCRHVTPCWEAFPNAQIESYRSDGDRLRKPVLNILAQRCDEIETDLMWLRDRVRRGNLGQSPADQQSTERVFDLLEQGASSIRRDLQWNIALADRAKSMLANTDRSGRERIRLQRPASEQEVRAYVKEHLPAIELGDAPEPTNPADSTPSTLGASGSANPTAQALEHEPDLSWVEASAANVSNSVPASRRPTARQRAARAAQEQGVQARRAADAADATRALAEARRILQPVAADSGMKEIKGMLASAERLVTRARDEVGTEQLNLLSGSGIRQRFMQAADAFDAAGRVAERRIREIDASLSTIKDLDDHGVTETESRSARSQRENFNRQIRITSSRAEAVRNEAATEENRRNVKRFAQKPTRELFLWLTSNDPSGIAAVSKTIKRKQLAAHAPNGQPRGREDFLDEYTIKLRDPQRITYLDADNGAKHAKVDKVVLHVHYPRLDADRAAACHFKNEAQATMTGAGVYRSTDSAALMADVLKIIDEKSRETSAGSRSRR
ncbi:MAG TPA: hypothetical protein VNZ04_11380, partial [Trinickia sp.]|nr:hypothetical protein [Trinickia sp.]